MPEDFFGPAVAATYDERVKDMFDPGKVRATVELLAELAESGPVLEFGIGTGRIALPLTQRGVRVIGIDLSEAMVEQMRDKPGGAEIPVAIGDFAATRVDGQFTLVYLVFNTINNLITQDEQVACFANASRHLLPGGYFVIEVGVPKLQRLAPGQTVVPFSVTDEHLGFDEYDTPNQGLISHHYYRHDDGRFERRSWPFRYVWPAELDLMARLADMTLVSRWASWQREEFTADSPSHISVWQLPSR